VLVASAHTAAKVAASFPTSCGLPSRAEPVFSGKVTQHEKQLMENQMKTLKVKENLMKATSKITKSLLFAAILACLTVVESGSAFAQQVFRTDQAHIFKNTCPGGNGCANWGETVSIDEPATVEPVVVIWSARYFANTADAYFAGLDVNGTGCQIAVYGPSDLDDIATNPLGHLLTVTFQWVVLPSDGVLRAETSNTFELCGGGAGLVKGDSINISQNTLSVAKY